MSVVRSYKKLQGIEKESRRYGVPPRDINSRPVSIENSSPRDVGIAVTSWGGGDRIPPPRFYLRGGESKTISINSKGGNSQWIWLLDPSTKKPLGHPTIFHNHANSFVIREGLNMWFVQFYTHPTYNP